MITKRVRLKPNKEQEKIMFWYTKVSRNFWNVLVDIDKMVYNGDLDAVLKGYKCDKYYSERLEREMYSLKPLHFSHLAKYYMTELCDDDSKKDWYFKNNQSFIYSSLAKEFVAIKVRNNGKMKYRSIKEITPKFPVRCDKSSDNKRESRIYVKKKNYVQVPSIGAVKFSFLKGWEFDLSCSKKSASVTFDGKYWYLNCIIDYNFKVTNFKLSDKGIGVDLGIRNFATLSDGTVYRNIRNLRRFKVLNKRLKHLQRSVSRKMRLNGCNKNNKTRNILKVEKKIRLIQRSIRNIRTNNVREVVADLIKKRPKYVSFENLNVSGMMKNKYIDREVANCSFGTFLAYAKYKIPLYNIEVRIVDRFYPSSKTCSSCGNYNKKLSRSSIVYVCSNCGLSIDRDFNASLNLLKTEKYVVYK